MKSVLIGTALMLISLNAFAGKTERDYMTNTVQPAVKEAEGKFKASCGCALKISVSDTLKSTDDMAQARNISNSITEGAPGYCNDEASNWPFANMALAFWLKAALRRHSSRIAILCPLTNHASKYLLLLTIRTRHCRNPPHSANLSQTQFGSWRLLLRVRTRSAKM